MPVEEHEVHEKVREQDGTKYGCFNRKPYADGYYALDRYYRGNGTFTVDQHYIKYAMSRECRFDMSLSDIKCDGCIHRGSGEAYNERVRSLGA